MPTFLYYGAYTVITWYSLQVRFILLFIFNNNINLKDPLRLLADHMLAMPMCEGVRRFMSLRFGRTQRDLENQARTDAEIIINHYTTSVNLALCDICWETGARLDNPSCITCHAVCPHCISRVGERCATCRQQHFLRLRILPPDCERESKFKKKNAVYLI